MCLAWETPNPASFKVREFQGRLLRPPSPELHASTQPT